MSNKTKKEDEPTKDQLEKAQHLKRNIEKIMGGRLKQTRARKKREIAVETKLNNQKNLTKEDKRNLYFNHLVEETNSLRSQRKKRTKTTAGDFDIIKVIGKGAFGEVRIVRHKENKQIYAMKTMIKKMMVAKNQVNHIVAERDLMVESNNPWLVKLWWAFQDQVYLYLVMEFCGGGDLMGLLIQKDILSEKDTRFYMSELAAAINHVHQLGFVHRDLKPDNVLIANDGHIRLSDFGLAKSFENLNDKNLSNWQQYVATLRKEDLKKQKEELKKEQNKQKKEEDNTKKHPSRKKLFSTVGTPDYIAIEVLYQKGYGKYVDWWSLGVIMFECLVGYAPFHAKDPLATCRKIVRYEKFFKFPPDVKLSRQSVDLMKRLVCPAHRRLGWDSIIKHPWFKGVDWKNLQKHKPPFVPNLKNEWDDKYFDSITSDQVINTKEIESAPYNGNDNRIWGYTFNREEADQFKKYVQKSNEMLKESTNNNKKDDKNNDDKENDNNKNQDKKD